MNSSADEQAIMSNDTLTETTAAQLRAAIQHGQYQCGDRLVELALSEELAVSQNTIREALRVLEAEGWLVKYARKGVFVRQFTANEASEVFALWLVLESRALDWAIDVILPHDRTQLRQKIVMVEINIEMNQTQRALDGIYNFHQLLAQVAGKRQTQAFLTILHNQARLLENMQQQHQHATADNWRQRIAAYFALLDAIDRGNSADAHEALDDAIMLNAEPILNILEVG